MEPFKNWLSADVIQAMATHLTRAAPDFDTKGFVSHATENLAALELRQRSDRICDALIKYLPEDFCEATSILCRSLAPESLQTSDLNAGSTAEGIRGWPIMPMADYVARRGRDHIALSLDVLREMTSRSSSEFAIRPLLQDHPKTVLETLKKWTSDRDEHVRRLVSEGTRPRLPWGIRLNQFVADPSPILPLLDRLKDDPSEYVRRSVANNLNDIAKDHPDVVVKIAEEWMATASPERERLIRHALRTLVKAGNTGALNVLGYAAPNIDLANIQIHTPRVILGTELNFSVTLKPTAATEQALIIDYIVHHVKANGSTTPKVFKWKTLTIKGRNEVHMERRHVMKPITTRRYYPGMHRVEIQVNGQNLGGANFELHVP